jgi:hypothetical protein
MTTTEGPAAFPRRAWKARRSHGVARWDPDVKEHLMQVALLGRGTLGATLARRPVQTAGEH